MNWPNSSSEIRSKIPEKGGFVGHYQSKPTGPSFVDLRRRYMFYGNTPEDRMHKLTSLLERRRGSSLKLKIELTHCESNAALFETIKANLVTVLSNFDLLHSPWTRLHIQEDRKGYQVASQHVINGQLGQNWGASTLPANGTGGLGLSTSDQGNRFGNILWNTFLRDEDKHGEYRAQVVQQLSTHLKSLEAADEDSYHKEHIFTLMNMQVGLDNAKFRAIAPHIRLRVICMVFFKYVNPAQLARLFEDFLPKVDLRNKDQVKSVLYKYFYVHSGNSTKCQIQRF